jgi:hypothetical protein
MTTPPGDSRPGRLPFLRGRLTFANLTALLALFVALGGTSYAALQLPKNSVGAKQIKKNSVTSKKVKPGSLLTSDFNASQRASLPGPQGLPGREGSPGPQGTRGTQGPPGPFSDPLTSGVTLRGLWGHTWTATATPPQADNLFYSYGGFTLSAAPTPHYIPSGGPAPAGCVGGTVANPTADPGHLCVYENDRQGTAGSPMVCSISGCSGSDDNGFQIALSSGGPGVVIARGSWAVTAP